MALKKLDVPSRQVMMDVTMAEIQLKDEIDFGVDWLFRGGAPSGRGAGGLLIRSQPVNAGVPGGGGSGTDTSTGLSLAQGFTYIINNAAFPGGIQAVLRRRGEERREKHGQLRPALRDEGGQRRPAGHTARKLTWHQVTRTTQAHCLQFHQHQVMDHGFRQLGMNP